MLKRLQAQAPQCCAVLKLLKGELDKRKQNGQMCERNKQDAYGKIAYFSFCEMQQDCSPVRHDGPRQVSASPV